MVSLNQHRLDGQIMDGKNSLAWMMERVGVDGGVHDDGSGIYYGVDGGTDGERDRYRYRMRRWRNRDMSILIQIDVDRIASMRRLIEVFTVESELPMVL